MGGIIGPYGLSLEGVGILEIIQMVTIAWVFYGILGGFVVLAVGGVVAGAITAIALVFLLQKSKE